MFKYASSLFAAALTFGLAAANAGDLAPDAGGAFMDACRYDYQRACAYVVPGQGRAARCLLDHEPDLSPRCLKAVKLAFAIEACLPDYDRYCRGVPRGPEAVACLSNRLDLLNPTCRRVVADNERYMRDPESGRYAYGANSYGAPGTAPYGYEGRPPYGSDYHGDSYPPREGEPPRYQPYGPYQNGAPSPGRYAEGPAPQSGERYSEDEEPRFQPYGGRSPNNNYDNRGYGAPEEPYGGDDREPPR